MQEVPSWQLALQIFLKCPLMREGVWGQTSASPGCTCARRVRGFAHTVRTPESARKQSLSERPVLREPAPFPPARPPRSPGRAGPSVRPKDPRRSRPLPLLPVPAAWATPRGTGRVRCRGVGFFSRDDGEGAVVQNPEPSVILFLSFLRMIHNV